MLLHVYGPDAYRRSRAVKEIVEKYTEKYPDGSVLTVDCEDEGALQALQSALTNRGLFAKATLVIVLNPAEATKELVRVMKSAGEVPVVTVLVVAAKKLPKDFAFLYVAGVGPKKQAFEELEGKEFLSFLKTESIASGYKVSDEELRAVAGLYAGDTWSAMTEIARVASGATATGAKDSFDFVAAMSTLMNGTRLEQRLRALFLLLENEDPAKVFNMAGGWARGSGKIKMADYDIAVKSGALEYGEALLDYALTAS
jgi:hypothetical protein